MQCDLAGRVAFVTGAAGGIGRAIVERLSANGAAVVVADINAEGAEAVAATLPNAIAAIVDIRDEAAIERAVDRTVQRFGRLDILVNNAGVNTLAHRVNIDAFPTEEWHRIVGIDLDGLFLMSRAALKPMLAAGRGGRIVNIGSVVGLAAMRLQSPFVAAKAGIIHLTRSMALELGPQGVLTNAVAPGSVMTEGTKKLFYGENGKFHDKAASFMRH
ncbi:MAG: SDR family oxidoreductase, partial [Rhizobiales bacterium]|nr:SDR family oxidoreductase [Hyphomicrobiales bacterium]